MKEMILSKLLRRFGFKIAYTNGAGRLYKNPSPPDLTPIPVPLGTTTYWGYEEICRAMEERLGSVGYAILIALEYREWRTVERLWKRRYFCLWHAPIGNDITTTELRASFQISVMTNWSSTQTEVYDLLLDVYEGKVPTEDSYKALTSILEKFMTIRSGDDHV